LNIANDKDFLSIIADSEKSTVDTPRGMWPTRTNFMFFVFEDTDLPELIQRFQPECSE
jgi:hypothetical protein